MPTKKTTKKSPYKLSRAKLQKRLDVLVERLQDFDLYVSTYADTETLVSDIENELSDLAYDVVQKKSTDEDGWG